mmetsp:Transcript_23328/g.27446  ORF Transcript_23328/g.27446 Transcript_23328/m.27446 type:complete len:245 (+) Transcript_23328:73-807(+)|eukprot:CAMPEP_0114336588 /NCGR_PEP_ID=MMETSP0101-20121206/5808_1 /TAXON_ID=38822 ORGANISM="Pteridomonas danica, Strain PT" /NCGR_SAMPLE_ID=MMETSP0101 /ASSEMBLY_ACC=CAM_ASM_000211 /LENGTH=244 /DNA_ID=CAMNT_0001468563 /DNA_START=12 /DNA_END=746 /DNA_ORIENTATION=-
MDYKSEIDIEGDGGILLRIEEREINPNSLITEGMKPTIKYTGILETTGEVFDSNECFSFKVGENEVIDGLDLAIRHMTKGDQAEISIRHDYAYGENGILNKIPAFAALKFTILVLESNNINSNSAIKDDLINQFPALPPSESSLTSSSSSRAAESEAQGEGEEESDNANKTRTLHVGGDSVKLDNLGPIVLNTDGTTSRIANWNQMTIKEQENASRLIAKRNKKRIESGIQAEGMGETRRVDLP